MRARAVRSRGDTGNTPASTEPDDQAQMLEQTLGRVLEELHFLAVGQHRVEEILASMRDEIRVCLLVPQEAPLQRKSVRMHSEVKFDCKLASSDCVEAADIELTLMDSGVETVDQLSVHTTSSEQAQDMPPFLSESWPADITMRNSFTKPSVCCKSNRKSESWYETAISRSLRLSNPRAQPKITESVKPRAVFPLFQDSPLRVLYDLVSIIVLTTDLVTLPVMVSWDMPRSQGFIIFEWFTLGFWTFDIGATFLTTFTRDGEVETRLRYIARHYMSGWFPVDTGIVLCDVVGVVVGYMEYGSSSFLRVTPVIRIVKVSRLFRIARLLRIVRLARIVEELIDRFGTGGLYTIFRILTIFVLILYFAHVVGCAYYSIGRWAPSDTSKGWLETEVVINGISTMYGNLDGIYLYTTAFHWAMAQMTLGSMELIAYSSIERVFSICFLLFGMLFSSTVISSLSAVMVNYQMRDAKRTEEIRKLRNFLRQNGVDADMAFRVRQQAENRLKKPERLTEHDVPALAVLSPSLRANLRVNLFKRSIQSHPFFRLWFSISSGIVFEMCKTAVQVVFLQPYDELFAAGTVGEEAFFLTHGRARYVQDTERSAVQRTTNDTVKRNVWFCEAALWMYWIHVGTLTADGDCELVVLQAEALVNALVKHRYIYEMTLAYATEYHVRVTTGSKAWHVHPTEFPTTKVCAFDGGTMSSETKRIYPTDLFVQHSGFADIASALPHELRRLIGIEALERAGYSRKRHRLRDEIEKGHCTVTLNTENDEIERSVVMTIVCVKREDDGRFLVNLGKVEDGEANVIGLYPGVKRSPDESDEEALGRMLRERLAPLQPGITLLRSYRDDKRDRSDRFGVPTWYFRTVHVGRFASGWTIDTGSRVAYTPAVGKTRSVSSGESGSMLLSSLIDAVTAGEVYAIMDGPRTTRFYTWLTEDERERFIATNSKVVARFLSGLEVFSTLPHEPPEEVHDLYTHGHAV